MSLQKRTLSYLATESFVKSPNFQISKFLPPLWQTYRNNFFHTIGCKPAWNNKKDSKTYIEVYGSLCLLLQDNCWSDSTGGGWRGFPLNFCNTCKKTTLPVFLTCNYAIDTNWHFRLTQCVRRCTFEELLMSAECFLKARRVKNVVHRMAQVVQFGCRIVLMELKITGPLCQASGAVRSKDYIW